MSYCLAGILSVITGYLPREVYGGCWRELLIFLQVECPTNVVKALTETCHTHL